MRYVGVTGFMSQASVKDALELVGNDTHAKLMVGVLASSKTLRGERNKYPERYPLVSEIARIFVPDRRALNLIHYATDDQLTLREQLCHLMKLGGPWLDGFQLNVYWPDKDAIPLDAKYVVLQLGPRALSDEGDLERLARSVYSYVGYIKAVLIDASGGRGVPIDPEKAEAYIKAIRDFCGNTFDIGIAGGLNADNLDRVRDLVQRYDLSIDAEGGLRYPVTDRMSTESMCRYVAAGFGMIED